MKTKYHILRLHIIKQVETVKRIILSKKRVHWKKILAALEIHQVVKLKADTPKQAEIMKSCAHKTASRMLIKIRTSGEDGVLYVQRIG